MWTLTTMIAHTFCYEMTFIAANKTGGANWWVWLAIVGLVIIVVMLFVGGKSEKFEEKEKLRATDDKPVNLPNIIESGFKARKLYDELKGKCHPDRFPSDPEKNAIANDIFQEITKNMSNLKRLEELKNEAADKLGITF